VVVSLSELDCLDLMIWLRTGYKVAERLHVSQSKVCRTVQKASALFDIAIEKTDGEWTIKGDQTFLNMERLVHQAFRWKENTPLRIEAQYYSGPLYCDPAPLGWLVGNFDYVEIHTPLRHLRTGVIDVWIGCYPDVPEEDDPDLVAFHLTRLPTHLVVSVNHPLLKLGTNITLEDVRQYPSLALRDGAFPKVQSVLQKLGLWNQPINLNRYSSDHWEEMVNSTLMVGYASAFTISLFQSPQQILPLPIPLEVGDSLIVRREYAEHPRLLKLLELLRTRAQNLAKQYPGVTMPKHSLCN